MGSKFLEAGKIINTHGVSGEVKIQPWADTPDFLTGFEHIYIDGAPVKVLKTKVHKGCVIAALDGVTDIDSAIKLKNKTVLLDRDETHIEEGRHFIADLMGLRAIDAETSVDLGMVHDVLKLPANDVYVIHGPREILIPAVDEFIAETNIDSGYIKFKLIEGM